ncbi:MAG: hypothetical protein CMM35_03145 [Rhodospirillaceae bacterium]|nr:hypothetical protein [Rhodospirillaceae bacterium]
MRTVVPILIYLVLSFSAQASSEFLTSKEIKNRVAAGPLMIKSSADYEFPVELTILANGSLEGVSANGYYDVGRWWIKGDLLCHKWDSWFDGFRKCYGVAVKTDALELEKPTSLNFTKGKTRLK